MDFSKTASSFSLGTVVLGILAESFLVGILNIVSEINFDCPRRGALFLGKSIHFQNSH